MEQQLSLQICPVCSLYLREGITLKNHLQTHSKEKVIDALLKQEILSSENDTEDTNLQDSNTTASITSENHFMPPVSRNNASIFPPSMFVQSSCNQTTQTTHSINFENPSSQILNTIQYIPNSQNSLIPQLNVNNLAYQQFITPDGNIILLPVYMTLPSNYVSNSPLVTPMINSCVMPTTNSSVPITLINSINPSLEAHPNNNVNESLTPVINSYECQRINNIEEETSLNSTNINNNKNNNEVIAEEEKDNDNEVASIFETSPNNKACEKEAQTLNAESTKLQENESSLSELLSDDDDDDDDDDDKSVCMSPFDDLSSGDNDETISDVSHCSSASHSIRRENVLSIVSSIQMKNNFSKINDKSIEQLDECKIGNENHNHDKVFSASTNEQLYSTSTSNDMLTENNHCSDLVSVLEKSPLSYSPKSHPDLNTNNDSCILFNSPIESFHSTLAERSKNFDFIVSNSDNAVHILPDSLVISNSGMSNPEKEHYILPNYDIPKYSSAETVANSDNSAGVRNSFLSSVSLISSVNTTMFEDVDIYTTNKNKSIYSTVKQDEEKNLYINNAPLKCIMSSRHDEHVSKENIEKSDNGIDVDGNSRISPFNIETDESMPIRGELSGQESLSGMENSLWELQVQKNACIQNFNLSYKKENTDVKIGLRSLMSEINFNMDTEISKTNNECFTNEGDTKVEFHELFRKKPVREFHCFYCKEKFDAWKKRQVHIEANHSDEDGLTIDSLFGKRIKCQQHERIIKIENTTMGMDVTSVETMIETTTLKEETITENNVVCRICSAAFKTGILLLKHLKSFHNLKKKKGICPTCFEEFPSTEEYQEHIQKVHPYECMTCGKKFHTRPGYMLHQKRHMKVKPYSCDVCDKSFVTKQKLTEHVNIHTGNSPIKCDQCDSNFKRYSNYQQHKKYLHMNLKRKLKDFICDCGEVFHSKMKLMWHQEIHDGKPKQCPFCIERFIHTSSLTRHIRKWHNEAYLSEWVKNKKKIKNVVCPVCNITYLHTSLQTHMKIHENSKPFSCNECSKNFRTKWNLQLHRWTHTSRSAKPYKCKICVKAYVHKTDFEAHLRSHSNCRPYACNICGRQFIRKYNCIRHVREHIEPRTHKCDVCGKMFSRSYYLSEHLKIHTGEKPHVCHVCGKTSATKSNHNKHVKMHNVRESVNSEG